MTRHAATEFVIEPMMESLRLEWPYDIWGDGMDVVRYDPAGTSEYCIRCGFSTLDGDAGPGVWRRGCPECGYGGYLLGLPWEDGSE